MMFYDCGIIVCVDLFLLNIGVTMSLCVNTTLLNVISVFESFCFIVLSVYVFIVMKIKLKCFFFFVVSLL